MFYLKFLLQFFWLLFAAAVGLVLCIVMFKHPNVDHLFARIYSWGALRLAGLRMDIQGRAHLKKGRPAIYIANHQSGLDMMTFGAIYPKRTVVIGKKELLYIPLFGFFYWAAGNILLNRQKSTQAVLELKRVTALMKRRRLSAWIFPEGTRNAGKSSLLPFKKGAFHMAIESGYPLIPIVCAPVGPLVSWRDRRFLGGTLPLRILPAIETEGLTSADLPRLLAQAQESMAAVVQELRAVPAREGRPARAVRRRRGKTPVLGSLLLAFAFAFITSACSSTPKDMHWTSQLYPPTLMVRRTPHAPARPKAMGSEPEFKSDPLPNEHYDCEPIGAMWKGMDLKANRECLSTVNTTKERLEVSYRLVRDPAPYLQPLDPEETPACLKETLPKIPVPREIFFQTQLRAVGLVKAGQEATSLSCVNARINLEDDELWGWKLPIGRVNLAMVFPMMELPSNDDETRMLLQAWGLRLLRDPERQQQFPVKIVPDFICRRCLGRDRWLEPHNPLPPLWP